MMRRLVGVVAVGAITVLALSSPASAATRPRISNAEFGRIVGQAWSTGKVTAAQRAAILTRPDLAATTVDPTTVKADFELPGYVPDPMDAPVGSASAAAKSQAVSATAAAVGTASRDRYIVYENWVGAKVVDYHFVVGWSYNGTNVIGQPSAYSYIKNATGAVRNLGIVTNSQYANYNAKGIYAWTVPLTGKWQECSGSSCDYYSPQVRFGVYFNNTYNYTVLTKY